MSTRAWLLASLLALSAACADEDDEREQANADEDEGAERDEGAGADRDASSPNAGAGRDAGRPDASARVDAALQDAASSAGERTETGTRDAAGPSDAGQASDAGSCPFHGNLSYTLARAAMPSADEAAAYAQIARAMDTAMAKYNCYADITRVLSVSYDPSVATADGNENGSVRFGSRASMNFVTAMHEVSHTLGVGGNAFRARVQDRVFSGPSATRQLREISANPQDVVHSDGTHFWPHGLNYETEFKTEVDAVNHCKMVSAIRQDLAL